MIMDANNRRFKLAASIGTAANRKTRTARLDHAISVRSRLDQAIRFNSVRVPWALQMYEENPVVAAPLVSANPSLQGKRVLEVLDAVIEALAEQVWVVDSRQPPSRGDWCCDTLHGDGLWHTAQYPESKWIADWQSMVDRYNHSPPSSAPISAMKSAAKCRRRRGLRRLRQPADAGCACLQPSWGDGIS